MAEIVDNPPSSSRQHDRGLEEFSSLKDAAVADNANVHGILANVSPMKKGKSSQFFDAKIIDDKAQVRVVGFSTALRKRMANFEDSHDPVALQNCRIKKARYSDELEIILSPTTQISKSPKKFQQVIKTKSGIITISNIQNMCDYDKVSVKAKVLSVHPPVEVGAGLTKQDVAVSDASGAIKITLWESNVNCIKVDISYELTNFSVRT